MTQNLLLKARGLYTFPNLLNDAPEGSLVDADNIVIDRDGIISPRRGFKLYGSTMGTSSTRASQLMTYKGRILRHWLGILDQDSNDAGTFIPMGTAYFTANNIDNSAPAIPEITTTVNHDLVTGDSVYIYGSNTGPSIDGFYTVVVTGVNKFTILFGAGVTTPGTTAQIVKNAGITSASLRIKYVEANGNFYFTSSTGIRKISALNSTDLTTTPITAAGGIKALDGVAILDNTASSGWFTADSSVAYRVVWGIKDSNNNLVLGSPSERIVVSNSLQDSLISDFNNLLTDLDKAAIDTLTLSGVTTDTSAIITGLSSTSRLNVGNTVTGSGIPGGTVILTVDGPTQVTLSNPATADATTNLTFGITIFTGTVSVGLFTVTGLSSTDLLSEGLSVTGANIPGGTKIASVDSSSQVTLTQAATGSATESITFSDNLSDTNYSSSLALSANATGQDIYTALQSLANSSFSVTGILTTGSAVITSIDTSRIYAGYSITGADIPAGATVVSVDSLTQITISLPATASTSETLTFADGVVGKLSTDLGANWVFLVPHEDILNPAPTGQLQILQAAFDNIVNDLNASSDIGIWGKLATSQQSFTLSRESSNVQLTFTIPTGVTASHFYQLYRSALAQSSGGSFLSDLVPDDELRLVYENNPTTAEIAAETVTYLDILPNDFRDSGANLYTNANSGEGILQANEIPPFSKDIALFKGSTFYANTQTKHRKTISLLTVDGILNEIFTIKTATSEITYLFSTVEDASASPYPKVLVSTLATPAQQIDETARSFVRVINKQSTSPVNAYYLSGPNDVPGIILLEAKDLETDPFQIYSSVIISTKFSPEINNDQYSDNEVSPNRIYFSKYQQPEAVPIVNYLDVGPKDKEILRILPLRDNLFILTQGGIYRLSGDSPQNFQVFLFDSSTQIKAPDTAVVLNNQIYMFSSQGIATISDTGVSIISRPIENKLLPLVQFNNFIEDSFAVSYESDRSYLLWTVKSSSDSSASICYRYNTFTNTWVPWNISKTCGVVNPQTDKLYLGAADVNQIEMERKDFSRLDFADRESEIFIPTGTVNDITLNLGSLFGAEAGDVIVQSQKLTISQFNRLLNKLDIDAGVVFNDYTALFTAVPGDHLFDKLSQLAVHLDNDAGVDHTSPTFTEILTTTPGYPDTSQGEQDAFNAFIDKINLDPGITFSNYSRSSGVVEYEVPISSINLSISTITLAYAVPFIQGPATLYKKITSRVVWVPTHFGDVSILKHVKEATMIFENMAFTSATASYSSDLSSGFKGIPFFGEGSGIWGGFSWGNSTWGGQGSNRPFRTYIPAEKQKCRYLTARFDHAGAFEQYGIFGISFTFDPISTRGYR